MDLAILYIISEEIFVGNLQLVDGRELRVNSGPPPPPRENSRFGDNPRSGGENSRFGDSSRSRGPPRVGSDNEHRVHVGNLAWGVDNASLESLFQEQGSVIEAKVIYDRDSGRSRGFGFVTFSSAEEVNRAIQSLDGVVSTNPSLQKEYFVNV